MNITIQQPNNPKTQFVKKRVLSNIFSLLKHFRFFFLFMTLLPAFSFQTKAQPPANCNWSVISEIDCDTLTNFKLWLSITCAGVTTDYSMNFKPGCCDSAKTATTVLSGSPCSVSDCANCLFKIKIQNSLGTQTYSNGQIYCCDGSIPDCVKCHCGVIDINCVTRTIKFTKKSTCLCH